MQTVGIGVALAIIGTVVTSYAGTQARQLVAVTEMATASHLLAAAQGLRRYVQVNGASLQGRVGSGPVVIEATALRGDYLPPEWSAVAPSGQRVVLAALAASDGRAMGVAYVTGSGVGVDGAGSWLRMRLAEAGAADPTAASVAATVTAAGLPAPASDGGIVTTSVVRDHTAAGALMRWAEPGEPAATRMAGTLDAGGGGTPVNVTRAVGVGAVNVNAATQIQGGRIEATQRATAPNAGQSGEAWVRVPWSGRQ